MIRRRLAPARLLDSGRSLFRAKRNRPPQDQGRLQRYPGWPVPSSRSPIETGANVAWVLTEAEEAQLEGALNLWRHQVRGWAPFWACVAGLVAIGLLGAGIDHLLAFSQPHPTPPCPTVAKCTAEILAHPIHVTGADTDPDLSPATAHPSAARALSGAPPWSAVGHRQRNQVVSTRRRIYE